MAEINQQADSGLIYFLIPMYNEEGNLATLHDQLSKVDKQGRTPFFVFSDDGSSDSSVEMVKELFADVQHEVLGDGSNHGPGYAFNTGFTWIVAHSKSEKDLVVTLEADNTSDLGILPQMLTIYDTGFDLVLASVYVQSGGFSKTTAFRKFVSFMGNMLMRLVFGIKVLTLSSFYRVYSVDLLRKISQRNEEIINEKGFICMVEILIKSIRLNADIIEVPMTLNSDARVGKSKMKVFKTTVNYLKFMFRNMFRK